ncbi:MAG: MotA/TolQ/ExbB proton channel family protein [Chthoniobacterales bacterium]
MSSVGAEEEANLNRRNQPALGCAAGTLKPWLNALWAQPNRTTALILALGGAVVFIGLLSFALSGRSATLLLDNPSRHFLYPFTIQNIMHVVFFVGLGELFVRWRIAVRENAFLGAKFLPEDDRTVLLSRDLGPIRKRVANLFDRENGFLPSLINLAILQFQSSSSVEQAAGVMSQQLELMSHRVDLRYGLVRFVAWVVPTLGFIGTVFSLGASLSDAGNKSKVFDIRDVASTLGVGFDCTMVALIESAILVFLLHLVQEREEGALNSAGDYTLRNLINRLFAAPGENE